MKTQHMKLLALTGTLVASVASAHIGVSGATPAYAGASFDADFTVGHGCDGADTFKVRVQIPEGVTSVRAVDSSFGKAVIIKDGTTGNVTAVEWAKPVADVKDGDTHYYHLGLRMKLPNKPFTTVFFPTTQTCRKPDGTESVVEWSSTSGGHDHSADSGTPSEGEPAPSLFIYPTRVPGWNKYTVEEHVHDLTVFKDALIVWSGNKAYSFNPATQGLIESEPNTEALVEIHPGTEIWVKY